MAPNWLYEIGGHRMSITREFMCRIRNGDPSALRALRKVSLTDLYRQRYSLRTKWEHSGLFYDDEPTLEHIPIVMGGRHPIGAWLKDYVAFSDRPDTQRRLKAGLRLISRIKRDLTQHENLSVMIPNELGGELRATKMKPNPNFELVVVNKHDRAALLKLLAELDATANVQEWLGLRTTPSGATRSRTLYNDYVQWCDRHKHTPCGGKTFAQSLVQNGVVKLVRSKEGERYELELRPAPRTAGSNRG